MTVAGIVLAAGAGRRLGRPKALVTLGGLRLVDLAVDALRGGGCERVVVVAGAVPISDVDAMVVDNPGWMSGMGSSLRVGLAALTPAAPDASAAVVGLVDTPGVGPQVVRRLLDAHAAGADVAAAAYHGARRTPVLLGRRWWSTAAEMAVGDLGARAFLDARADLVVAVECGDIADYRDIDTSADLRELS